MSATSITIVGVLALIGAVASVEFAAAPARRGWRAAVVAAALTAAVLAALFALAAAFEWWQQS
jgi:hypothetical protein